MHSVVDYYLLRTTGELDGFVPQWRSLFARDPNATPFQSPEWLAPWWKQFGSEQMCAVVITRNDETVGLLPFYLYQDVTRGQRQLLPFGVGTTDYLDGVFTPECSSHEIGRAVKWLCDRVSHEVFCASQLPASSRLLAALRQGTAFGEQGTEEVGARVFVTQSEPCSRMAAVTISQLPPKIRRNAMYYRNRAQRDGALDLLQADESNWEAIFVELVRLHTERWQTRGENGVLVDERVVAWHREAIPLLLRAGLLRLMALRLSGRIIAVLYSLFDRKRENRTQYFYITAFSPEHAKLRPGTLLIAYAVEHAAREGVSTIDMLRGDESYKQIWHMEKVVTWCCTQATRPAASQREENAA